MDLQVLCVFLAVAYVNVIARIMCNFQPKSWTTAMQLCLNLSGTPVSFSSVPSLISCCLNGSFWTSDYATWIATTDSPVDCEYRTLAKGNQLSESRFGNCSEIRYFICCNNTMIESCVKNGTWKEASKCNETNPTLPAELPMGDYWLRRAYRYQIDTFTGGLPHSIDRCGMLGIDGNTQFVTRATCATLHYSFCEVDNYTGSGLSVCGLAIVTNQSFTNAPSFASQKTKTFTTTILPINETMSTESILRNNASSPSVSRSTMITTQLSSNIPSFASQNTEQLTVQIMSINENTSTDSRVRSHVHSSSGSVLAIGLGVSFSIVTIIIITTFGVCVYRKRKRNADCIHSREECGRTELGDIHVYDEISNNEESLYAASKVDIYDKLRNDVDKEHAYDIIASAPKYQ